MKLSGQNVYRIKYKIKEIKDVEFVKTVVAFSEKEAIAYMGQDDSVLQVSLVDSEITMIIPDQYIKL